MWSFLLASRSFSFSRLFQVQRSNLLPPHFVLDAKCIGCAQSLLDSLDNYYPQMQNGLGAKAGLNGWTPAWPGVSAS
jgi:hypothetical protein